jgi:ABC-type microcin C transport system permease subunit YejE
MDEIGQMPLHPTIACEPPKSHRLRRWAPLLLFLALIAVVLAPGLIANDRPFQVSLCEDLEPPTACAPPERTIRAAMQVDRPGSAGPRWVH